MTDRRLLTVREAREIWLSTAPTVEVARMMALAADRDRARAWAAAVLNPKSDRRCG